MIHEFIRQFADIKVTAVRIGNSYYQCEGHLSRIKNSVKIKPFAAGVFLGERFRSEFRPSVALLDIISKKSDKKIFVNKKGEWLFLCGRDIFGDSVVKADFNEEEEYVLVQNENDENLGYGVITADVKNGRNKSKVVVKNLFDRGNFLRREKNDR
ncbi:MAG: hypothetical protein Q8O89_06920 [Nanoarchaeota archaeon]|nr:hypothetical protein [Nanoarchaeota archaeon]